MSKIVAWNPNDREQFVYSGRKLQLTEFHGSYEGENSLRILQELDATDITCLEWHPFDDSSLMAFGSNQGEISLVNWDRNQETVICKPSHIGRRSCNAISWNKQSHSRLAASFDNLKSEGCVTVWDFEQEKLLRLSHGEAVSTLSWLPDNQHLLVLGTAMGWIRVCDMRSGSQQPAISFLAHPAARPRKIKGIRPDPFQHSVLATFSDGFGDPIRLWDLRRNGPGKTQLTEKFSITVASLGQRDTTVQDVAWSPSRPNVIAVASTGQKHLAFYSTSSGGSTPLRVMYTNEPVKCLSWRGTEARHKETYSVSGTVFEVDPSEKELADRGKVHTQWESFKTDEALALFPFHILDRRPHHRSSGAGAGAAGALGASGGVEERLPETDQGSVYNRLLLGTTTGCIDVDVRDSMGLTVSSSGMIAQSLGATITLNSNECAPYPFSISEDSVAGCLNNTTLIMRYRGSAGYSVEEIKNIEVLSGEMDHLYGGIHQLTAQLTYNVDSRDEIEASLAKLTLIANATMEVFRMWVWADRFEAMSNQTNLSLTNCGVLNIIQNETKLTDQQNYRSGVHSTLGAEVFLSKSRTLCKKICGWIDVLGLEAALKGTTAEEEEDDQEVLEVIVSECLDGFERGCAMALWHGNIHLAVSILRRAMDKFEKSCGETTAANAALSSPGAVGSNSSGVSEDSESESLQAPSTPQRSGPATAAAAGRHHSNSNASGLPTVETEAPFSPGPKSYNQEEEDESDENDIDWDEEVTSEYMKLVSLVCMCLAGFSFGSQVKLSSSVHGKAGGGGGGGGGAGVAGVGGGGGHKTTPSTGSAVSAGSSMCSAWASMCKHVITQLKTQTRRGSCYLTACCIFLLSNINEYTTEDEYNTLEETFSLHGGKSGVNAIKAGYRVILSDDRITLDDRIAFAATFLSNGQAVDWLTKLRDQAKVTGRLDCLMITGLSSDGLDILQQYIDRYDDLQTVALLVSRIVDNNTADSMNRPPREWIWLHEYRTLLNKWGLFIYRARLDVELGRRYRNRSEVTATGKTPKKGDDSSPKGLGGGAGGRGGAAVGGGGGGGQSFKASKSGPFGASFSSKGGPQPHQDRSKRVLYKISPHSDFPHIYLRCSYCGTSLPVDGMQTTKAESLRSQKSVLNCCGGCSKQLPRCYVCQLYMGMVNPYRELNRTMTQKRINADNLLAASVTGGAGASDARNRKSFTSNLHIPGLADESHKSDHNVIDFGRWFFFCQHCRHGGHANCIDEWFGGGGGVGSAVVDASSTTAVTAKSSKRIVCGVNGCNCNCKARK